MTLFLQIVVNGLQSGAIYVLFAVGLTLVFGVMRIVNFAHGEIFTGAAYISLLVITTGSQRTNLPHGLLYLGALVLAVAAAALLGVLMYEALFRRLAGNMIAGLLVAVGVSLGLQTLYRHSFGSAPRRVPSLIEGQLRVAGISLSYERLLIIGVALAVTIALALYLKHTRAGLALRAVSEDAEAASMQGINYRRVSRNGFVLSGLLAAVAAVLIAPTGVLHPTLGTDLLMKGFIVIILGGLGNLVGAIYAGILLGFVESIAATLINVTFATALAFGVVILVLLIRPEGLMLNAKRS